MSSHNALPSARHVLVIEDNDDGRESLRQFLALLGHRVDVAADGAEGVRKALEAHPEIAIVDIGLPEVDGYQVARQLRKALGRSITLIAHTAYPDARASRKPGAADFDAWLVKPADLSELLSWVEEQHEGPG